jgi:hypothetical protein
MYFSQRVHVIAVADLARSTVYRRPQDRGLLP